MSKLAAAIYSKLSGSTAVTALTGTRIFPGHIPQGKSYPNCRFIVSDIEQIHTSTGHDKTHRASLQVDCYAVDSYLTACNLSEAIREALNTQSTTFGTLEIFNSHITSEIDEPPFRPADGSDKWIYGRSLDCNLHFLTT